MLAHGSARELLISRGMAGKKNPMGPQSPVANRVRLLRLAMGYADTAPFARYLGITRSRLANVEGGHPLGIDLATRMVQMTDVSRDWLYDGKVAGMPVELLRKIQAVEAGATRNGRTSASS